MVNENIIPIENKKPVAEVRYWDYESKESSKEPTLKNIDITEKDFFISCPLHDSDKRTAGKIGFWGAVGLGVLTVFCPPAGAVVGGTCAAVATTAKAVNCVAKNIVKDKHVEECSEIIGDVYDVVSNGEQVVKEIKKKL